MDKNIEQNYNKRDEWLKMSPEELLRECDFSTQKRSGKGGQKINKTSSAVRLFHPPTSVSVLVAESRYQSENRLIAARKIQRQIALQIRSQSKGFKFPLNSLPSLKNPLYPVFMATLLDILEENSYSISETAAKLDISSAKLVKILSKDPELWQKINLERKKRNMIYLKQ